MLLACGSLGMLFAVGLEDALGDGLPVAAGGNGIALGVIGAWLVMRDADAAATRPRSTTRSRSPSAPP